MGRSIGTTTVPRMQGEVPNTLAAGGGPYMFNPALDSLAERNGRRGVKLTVRYDDERGLERWEQTLAFTFAAEITPNGLQLTDGEIDLGEPKSVPRTA